MALFVALTIDAEKEKKKMRLLQVGRS